MSTACKFHLGSFGGCRRRVFFLPGRKHTHVGTALSSANLTPVFALRLSHALHHPNALNGRERVLGGRANGLRWPELLARTGGESVRNTRHGTAKRATRRERGRERGRGEHTGNLGHRPVGERSGVTSNVSQHTISHLRCSTSLGCCASAADNMLASYHSRCKSQVNE
jgi:hypothetical protein